MISQRVQVILAFLTIYLVWGSTYLAIYYAIEDFPPFLMASIRFISAGIILIILGRCRKAPWPSRSQWLDGAIVGTLMLTFGNGFLSLAETEMPTGIAALLIATVPMWIVVFTSIKKRAFPKKATVVGLVLGAAGVVLLANADGGWEGGEINYLFVALILLGSIAWAIGSLRGRNSGIESMRMRSGVQMLGGGVSLFILGKLSGEHFPLPQNVGLQAWLALFYLITAGSVLAFTCYVWLMRTVDPGAAATYAFVNPIVALLIGALVLNETITWKIVVSTILITAAVILVIRPKRIPRM